MKVSPLRTTVMCHVLVMQGWEWIMMGQEHTDKGHGRSYVFMPTNGQKKQPGERRTETKDLASDFQCDGAKSKRQHRT